jgi:hypothetical protein
MNYTQWTGRVNAALAKKFVPPPQGLCALAGGTMAASVPIRLQLYTHAAPLRLRLSSCNFEVLPASNLV